MQKKGFLKGAAILGIAGILVKVIGLLYRIPLANIIGTQGAGVYGSAYPFYTTLLMVSTAGLPPVISKLVAQNIARGDRAGAKKIFKVALALLSTFGLIAALVLYLFSQRFAILSKDPLAQLAISYIAPALFFVSVMSAIRGYFQGMQNMFPTAMTQMVEQVGKVVMGLYFASTMVSKGFEYGAAGAMLGIMLSELLALLVLIVYYFVKRKKISKKEKTSLKTRTILKDIVKLAIPILIGASIMPLVTLTDMLIIKERLMDIGYSMEEARSTFGIFSLFVNPLVNVPGTVSLAFCVSILPVISAAKSTGSLDVVRRNSKIGLKMAMLVGMPSAVGLAILATPIMDMLYGYKLTSNEVALAGSLLAIIAGGVIFLSILQTMNGVLQGLGRVMVPVIALGSGALVKIILNYVLVGIPSINIYGAPISTFACYMVAAIIDIFMVKYFTNVKFGIRECVIRPILASIFMGASTWGVYALLFNRVGNAAATIIAVFVGIIMFVVCIPIFNVLTRHEIINIPGGKKMIKLYDLASKEIK